MKFCFFTEIDKPSYFSCVNDDDQNTICADGKQEGLYKKAKIPYHLQKNPPTFWLDCKWFGKFGLPDRKISKIKGTFPNGKFCFIYIFCTSSRPCANS